MKPTGYDAPITDEIILTQSDPMKVIPPEDDQIIITQIGTAIMSERTAKKLMNARAEVIAEVLEIIKGYKSYHNGAHWTLLREIVGKIEELVEVTG